MQQSKNIVTDSKNRISLGKNENADEISSGEELARLFKYYRFTINPNSGQSRIPFNRVSAKSFYKSHKQAFDDTARFFSKHNINVRSYIKFFVCDLMKTGSDVDKYLYSKPAIKEYIVKLQAIEKREKIYKWFMKSVNNIVDMCLRYGYMTGKDCILDLIRKKKLAQEYVTGRISKYFLAAMPNFKEIIPKLDHFAKDEFKDLYDKFDIYNTEINNAYRHYRNRLVNPLVVVDSELEKCK